MSGHIRRRVGIVRENIRRQIRECPDFDILADSNDVDIRTSQLETSLFNIMLNKQKLTNSVKDLYDLDEQWLKVMETMGNDDRVNEEAEYKTVATDDYQLVLVTARDKIAYLQVKMTECNMHLADMHGTSVKNLAVTPAMQTPSGSPPPSAAHNHGQQSAPPVPQVFAQTHAQHAQQSAAPAPQVFAPPVHLPKMDLKDLCITFDGSARNYSSFMDSYISFVHSQPIAEVVKLNYLRSCLKGKALNAIRGLPTTNASYNEALSILKHRFGDPSVVKEDLYADFRKMGRVVSLADLSKFCDRLDETLRLLRTLNEDPDKSGFNPVLVPMLKEKLPGDILKEVESTGSVNTLSSLRDILYQVCQVRERCARISKVENDNPIRKPQQHNNNAHNRHNNNRNNNNDRSVFSVQLNQTKGSYGRNKTTNNSGQTSGRVVAPASHPCVFCEQQHMATECRQYSTTEARLQRLKDRRCCFRCGRQNHMRARCVAKLFCRFCKGNHMSALCFQQFGTPSAFNNRSAAKNSDQMMSASSNRSTNVVGAQNSKSATVASVTEENEHTQTKAPTAALMVVSAFVFNSETPEHRSQVQVFLDPGAQRTFVTRELKDKLKLNTQQMETLNIYGFGPNPINLPSGRVNLTLELKDQGQFRDGTFEFCANSVPGKYIRHPQTRPMLSAEDYDKLRSWSDVQLDHKACSSSKVRPDILIGAEYFWDLVAGKPKPLPSGLKVIPTKLGPTLSGANRTSSNMVVSSSVVVFSISETPDDAPGLSAIQPEPDMEDYSRLWMMHNAPPLSGHDHNDEEVARKFFKETTTIEDGRVKVRFPMKNKDVIPSDNTELSLHRFRGLAKRFLQNPELYETYRKQIRDYLAEGILEYAPMDKSEMTSYLPHHAVLKEGSSTKCRIVFDASAKPARDPNARSVNECLYKGPVRPPSIQRMLIEFGLYPHACISDIQQAFLQLLLNEKDRGLTQLYWFKDDEHPERVDDNLVVLQFTRVLFGVISSPYLLEEAVQLILSQSDTDLDKRIARCIYVDNVVLGMMSEEQVFEYFRHSKELFQKYKMNMRQYLSSSSKFNEQLEECDRTSSDSVKVLGMPWNAVDDTMSFVQARNLSSLPLTKRMVAKSLATVFDPLGKLSPLMTKAKMLHRDLCLSKLDWDEVVSEEQKQLFLTVMSSLMRIDEIKFPRFVGLPGGSEFELHTFCDASQSVYAAVTFIRFTDASGLKQVRLLMSKARMDPSSHPSIPKMELLALELGTIDLQKWIREEVRFPEGSKLTRQVVWSDSKVVLAWLKSTKEYGTFVNNRLRSIRQDSNGIEFKYVPSADNPADLATRGKSIDELMSEESIWWSGPSFLHMSEAFWPVTMSDLGLSDSELQVMAKEQPEKVTVMPTRVEHPPPLIDWHRHSSYTKMIRVTVLVMRAVKKFAKKKKLSSMEHFKEDGTISVEEVKAAEIIVLKECQRESFGDMFDDLRTGGESKNSTIIKLNLQLESNGLIYSGGRLQNAMSEWPTKLILLPKNNGLTDLVIRDCHERSLHVGPMQTLSEVRQRFWVLRGMTQVKKVINRCHTCRRAGGGMYGLPLMPDLPKERVNRCIPFEHLGVDAFGPTFVMFGEEKKKVWVYLYTCLTTRLVHLEYVTDLSANTFLAAFNRFTSLYTVPSTCLCDNATQFRAAEKMLKKTTPDPEFEDSVMNFMAFRDVKFKYIRSFSPWEGGVYERMVGVVKRVLNKTVCRKLLQIEEFRTKLTSVQGVVNRRPLCPLTGDRESVRTLRPIDFVVPLAKSASVLQENPKVDDEDYKEGAVTRREQLNELWLEEQRKLDSIWKTFQTEYLASLRQRETRQHGKQKPTSEFKPNVDDVVIVHDANHPRSLWKLGRIMRLHEGDDQQVRAADVLMGNGRTVSRSVKLLYPVEVASERNTDEDTTGEVKKTLKPENTPVKSDEEVEKENPVTATKVRRSPRLNPTTLHTLMILCLVSMFEIVSTAKVGECLQLNDKLRLVESDSCVPYGYVIYKDGISNKLCWSWVTCTQDYHLTSLGFCGQKCKCPTWSTGCTHTPITPTAEQLDVQKVIGEKVANNICATSETMVTERCDETPVMMTLPMVQFVNNETTFVRSLKIEVQQSTPGEYRCIGDGQLTGTPEFCEHHECEQSGTQLCYAKHDNQGYYTENEMHIPIRAWGSMTVKVWRYKETTVPDMMCRSCEIECIKGGVRIHTTEKVSLMEICTMPVCYSRPFPTDVVVFMFSPEITLHDHEVHVKAWKEGVMVFNDYQVCSAQPFCESIPYMSWTMFKNWHCAPKSAMLVLFVAVWFGGTTSLVLSLLVRHVWYIVKKLTRVIVTICWKGFRKCRRRRANANDNYLPMYANDEQIDIEVRNRHIRYRPTRRLIPVMLLYVVFCHNIALVSSNSCSEVVVVQAQQHQCSIDANEMKCSLSQTTEITLATKGQMACLAVNDMANRPAGIIEVTVTEVSLRCLKTDVFYTRDFDMKTASTKRCPGAGTCQYSTDCDNIQDDTLIDELTGEANNKPGFSGCFASCACASCGCFYCTQSCLFYRTYAYERSLDIYEVFECPEFHLEVEVLLVRSMGSTSLNYTAQLRSGVPYHVSDDLTVTLKSTTLPVIPALNKRFISNGRRIIMSDTANSGQLIAGSIGQFQCSTQSAAEQFDCQLARNMCACEPRRSVVDCSCRVIRIDELFRNSSLLLPVNIGNTLLIPTNNSVRVNFQQITGLQLQVTLSDMRLKTLISHAKCRVRQVMISGCYSCMTGAKLNLRCYTDQDDVVGTVECSSINFVLKCKSDGQWNNLTIRFDSSEVNENCEVRCPGGGFKFDVKGTLNYVPIGLLGETSNVYVSIHSKPDESSWGLWSSILTSQYFVTGYIVGSMIAAVAIMYLIRRLC